VNDKRDLLRHLVATVAYRGAKAVRDAPAEFADYTAGSGSRTPAQILAHMGDLFDWVLSQASGAETWHDSAPLEWTAEVDRFFAALAKFDEYLASARPLAVSEERLFQGAVADALTHVGQLTLLRRLCGAAIRGENYSRAAIVAGRVGPDQAAPRREW
jgi:hypothetical protein